MSISAPNGTRTATASGAYRHRKRGGATYRIIRYADDFVIMVHGSQAHADALWDEVADVLAPLGLRLSAAKSRVCHLDEGLDFSDSTSSGAARGERPSARLHLPVEEGTAFDHGEGAGADEQIAVSRRSPTCCASSTAALRGWCNYFRHGVSARTFHYLDLFAWRRVTRWLRKRHKGINWKALYRRFLTARPGNRPAEGNVELFRARQVEVTRYRWRGEQHPHTMGEHSGRSAA